jgi:hypothetical protein
LDANDCLSPDKESGCATESNSISGIDLVERNRFLTARCYRLRSSGTGQIKLSPGCPKFGDQVSTVDPAQVVLHQVRESVNNHRIELDAGFFLKFMHGYRMA